MSVIRSREVSAIQRSQCTVNYYLQILSRFTDLWLCQNVCMSILKELHFSIRFNYIIVFQVLTLFTATNGQIRGTCIDAN